MKKNKKAGSRKKISDPAVNIGSGRLWVITVFILAFVLSAMFSGSVNIMLEELDLFWAFIILLIIICINIFFDLIATAAQAAQELPFHSLASRKTPGAAQSISFIRHAPQVSSICADVIGDIAGIISGGVTALIITRFTLAYKTAGIMPSLILTGLVSSLTIGGKAFCKTIAMRNSNTIVYYIGKLIYYISLPFRRKTKGRK